MSSTPGLVAPAAATRVFYGWWVLLACTFGLAFGYSNAAYLTFGLFVLPLSETFGWGRGDISVGSTVMSLCVATLAPVAGLLVDRYGPRRVLLPSILAFVVVLCGMFFLTPNIWHFYLACVLVGVSAVCTAPATYARVVVSWFDRRRGLALGIALTGIGVGAAVLPHIIQRVTAQWGWRYAYLAVAGCVLLTWPILALVLRNEPRELGLNPDGAAGPQTASDRQSAATAVGLTAGEAARRPSFWLMIGSFAIFGFYTLGVVVHFVPLLVDRGLERTSASLMASSIGIALIFGRLISGYLLDRLFAPRVVVTVMVAPVVALGILASGASSESVLLTCAILLGIGLGAELDFMSYLLSRYFGLRAYAQLYGYAYGLFALGSAFGPLFMGYVYQSQATYTPALWTLCILTAVALVPFMLLGPYPSFASSSENQ